MTVTDAESGVDADSLQYAWTQSTAVPASGWTDFASGETLKQTTGDGNWYLHIRAQDLVGNVADAGSNAFVMANVPPVSPVSPPSVSGNNRLADLRLIDGPLEVALSLVFSALVHTYKAETGKAGLTIAARAEHEAASVTLDGLPLPDDGLTVGLETGDNNFTLAVRAENGDIRSYTLTIRRTEPEEAPQPVCPFLDIRGHWAEAAVCEAFTYGLVQGETETRFAPDRQLTRVEAAIMLARLAGPAEENARAALPFADASDIPAWAEDELRAAVMAGIVKGYPDGTFQPHRLIIREEMAAMVVGAADAFTATGALSGGAQTTEKLDRFADARSISGWARPHMHLAVERGWILGDSRGLLMPLEQATRAEATATILRLWKSLHPAPGTTNAQLP